MLIVLPQYRNFQINLQGCKFFQGELPKMYVLCNYVPIVDGFNFSYESIQQRSSLLFFMLFVNPL